MGAEMAQYSMVDLFDAVEEAESARDAAEAAGQAAVARAMSEAEIGHDVHAALATVEAFVAAQTVVAYDGLITILEREISAAEAEYAAQDDPDLPLDWGIDWDDLPLD